jgi:hypothetical protein
MFVQVSVRGNQVLDTYLKVVNNWSNEKKEILRPNYAKSGRYRYGGGS